MLKYAKIKSLIVIFLLGMLLSFLGCVHRQVEFPRQVKFSLADSDGNDNIFFGVPKSPADTVLNRIGYSLGYSDSLKLALWVSYYSRKDWVDASPLTGRKFKPDPDIPPQFAAKNSDYYGSGYDRGHLAMQADMRGRSVQCELEACYLSNVAPQVPRFNRGIWLELEEKIRDYVRRDGDCWIITGPVFFGPVKKTIGEDSIPVPDAFYKIVVDTVRGTLVAAAFVIPNKSSQFPPDSFAVSIDSVEALTHIDFFPDLPDEVEERIEAQPPDLSAIP